MQKNVCNWNNFEFSIGVLISLWVQFMQSYACNIPNFSSSSYIVKYCFWIIARNIKCGLIIHGEDSISRLFYKTILKVSFFFFWFKSSCCAIIMTDTVARRRSVETVFLRISQNSQEKHLCQSLFFVKVASLGSSASLRTRIWLRYFSVNFYRTFPLAAFVMISNARVYNLSSGPYIADFSPVVAKKRNIFE